MNLRMLILLTLCAAACAMVVRNKRNATRSVRYCAPVTACAWVVYKSETLMVESTITNEYCECDPSTSCQMYLDDTEGYFHVYRCLPITSTTTMTTTTVTES